MKCRKAQGMFSEILDGELVEDIKKKFLAHIDGCEECSKALQIFRQKSQKIDG